MSFKNLAFTSNNLIISKEYTTLKSDGFNKAVISFNGSNPTFFFNGKDASNEFEKIKSKTPKELVKLLLPKDEPIDMSFAKSYLEAVITSVFNFRNKAIKYSTYGAEKNELVQLVWDAGDLDEFLQIYNSGAGIRVNCIYQDYLYDPCEYNMRKSINELLSNIDVILRNIILACQNAYVYKDQPNYDEYAEYCTFILGCINYTPLAA